MTTNTWCNLIYRPKLALAFGMAHLCIPALAGIYNGETNDATFIQLQADVETHYELLTNKVAEANAAGVNTDYAQVTQVTLELFKDTFIPWDKANLDSLESAHQKEANIAAKDPVYSAYGAVGLPFDELTDCIEIADTAIAELDAQIAAHIVLSPPPNFATGTLTLAGTHYQLNGRTVIPSRFFWQPEDQESIWQAFGRMGATYYGMYPHMSDTNQVSTPQLSNVVRDVQNLATFNAYPVEFWHATVASTTADHWLANDYPEVLVDGKRFFNHYDIDHPLVRQWEHELFQQVVTPAVAELGEGVRYHLLNNEPRFPIRQGNSDAANNVSDHTYDKFATWLESKYTTLANINSVYGSHYADFPTAARANYVVDDGVSESLQGGPIWYDWCRFNMDRVNEWHTFLHDEAHAADDQAATYVKIWGEGSIHTAYQDQGIDYEYLTKLLDIPGSDSQCNPLRAEHDTRAERDWQNRYAFEWRAQGVMMDFIKSISPEKPYIDAEWHGFIGTRWRDFHMEPDYIRSILWMAASQGLSGINAWFWNRKDDGSIRTEGEFVGSPIVQPIVLNAYGRTMKEINAHADQFAAMLPELRHFVVYYNKDSGIQDPTYSDNMTDVYEALKLLNIPVGFTTPSDLLNVTNSNQTLIIPRTEFISDADLAGLLAFDAAGGKMVLVDPESCFIKNELGFARTINSGLNPLATVTHGEIYTLAQSLATALSSRRPTLAVEIDITDPNGLPAFGVLAFQTHDLLLKKTTLSLINVSQESRAVTLRPQLGQSTSFNNLITQETEKATLIMAPMATFLLETQEAGNQPPAFSSDPILAASGAQDAPYISSITHLITDPESDPIQFTKLSGPAWLSIDSDGTLSGTPSEIGTNLFLLSATAAGGTDTATLRIVVDPSSAQDSIELYDDFEDGLGHWIDGDPDARRLGNTDWSMDTWCMHIRDNTGDNAAFSLVDPLDLTAYYSLTISFSFIANGMETGEEFWVQLSTDGGTNWTTIQAFVSGTDFNNTQREEPELIITNQDYTFTDAVTVRFVCHASEDNDNVYIDNIRLTAMAPGSGWNQFILDYGLSGNPEADADNDGQSDLFEYALNGHPTSATNAGSPSYVELSDGMVKFFYLKRTDGNSGVTYQPTWTTNLVSSPWTNSWDATFIHYSPNVGFNQVEQQLDIKNKNALFLRLQIKQP